MTNRSGRLPRKSWRRPKPWIESAFAKTLFEIEQERGKPFTDEELKRAGAALGESVVGDMADILFRELLALSPDMLAEHRGIRQDFERGLDQLWGSGFNLLESYLVASVEIGVEFHRAEVRKASRENDLVFESVVRLHARACRIAGEILSLMRAGYAMGAMARVRALQENVFVAMFIAQHGQETAERYLLHQEAAEWRAAVELNTHSARLEEEAFSEADLKAMKARRDELASRFDMPCFDRDYGWALLALRKNCSSVAHAADADRQSKHRVTFVEIEKDVDLAHYRPYYRMATRAIHADSRSLYWDLGVPEGFEDLLLYGPTNDGFVEPANVTAHLMQLMTLSLVMCREITADRLWAVVAAGKLTEAMGEALYVSATELDGRIKHFPFRPTKARVSGRIPRKGRRPDPWP